MAEANQGSPPRARGRRRRLPRQPDDAGLTPACAGTSSHSRKVCPRNWAHPRVRGDVLLREIEYGIRVGSPPRARGRPAVMVSSVSWLGLTPACAGTSLAD